MVFTCPQHWDAPDLPEFSHYPYPLSDFQKYAIQGILQDQHVLITAHTGSGKTLPAEFAIEHWTSRGKKVIYTSPIKALSNQKYYQFSQEYPHISFGLLTGDIKTNPTAQVLLMTTEILMNYLLFDPQPPPTDAESEQPEPSPQKLSFQISMDELAAVVFDEVHYINDAERGQNWEKTLIALPPHVQRIMLSATIDSPHIFAQWNEAVSNPQPPCPQKQVWICSSDTRVVPLTHYAYITVPQSIYKKPQLQQPPRIGKLKPHPSTTAPPLKQALTKEQETEVKQTADKFLPLASSRSTFKPVEFAQTFAALSKTQNIIKTTRINRPLVLNGRPVRHFLYQSFAIDTKIPCRN